MNLLDLSAKTILITGGCGAIGRVVVRILAEHGATVAVNDILAEDEAAQILADCGDKVVYFKADVTDPAAVEQLLPAVEAKLAFPDTVCCHLGMVHVHPVEQFPLDHYDEVMNVNLRSSFLVSQAASRGWIERQSPGHLIYTTSWVQDVPWPEITPYNISKAGMKTMMRGFAREMAPHQIRANAIAPGIVGVGMARRQWDTDPSYRARAEKAIPLGQLQTPESVAHAFLFLCSALASYMTGSVLLVDGGCSLYPMD